MPTLQRPVHAAFLFDMDGTLLTSLAAAERVWSRWAKRHGLDVGSFLPTIHGMRAVDTIRRQNLPGVDPEAEADWITLAEIDDVEGVQAIEGAAAFLQALPPDRWAVVTSAPRALALRRMEAAGLSLPPLLVSAEDVSQGKPAPDPYLLAAQLLGVPIAACMVFEDAAAGIRSAEAAGARVTVVTASHSHPMLPPHATLSTYVGWRVGAALDGGLWLRGPEPE
jgi:sugar-phosphatase